MIIEKKFKGLDGKERIWKVDTDNQTMVYKGLAKDFQPFNININNDSAQDLVEQAGKE